MKSMRNNRLNPILLSLLLVVACIFSIPVLSSYAQTSPSGGMKKTTSGGSLDVLLQPSPEPVGHTAPTSFKVSFLQKGTDTVQPHIDYDLIIKDSNGKQLFQASQLAGQ